MFALCVCCCRCSSKGPHRPRHMSPADSRQQTTDTWLHRTGYITTLSNGRQKACCEDRIACEVELHERWLLGFHEDTKRQPGLLAPPTSACFSGTSRDPVVNPMSSGQSLHLERSHHCWWHARRCIWNTNGSADLQVSGGDGSLFDGLLCPTKSAETRQCQGPQ